MPTIISAVPHFFITMIPFHCKITKFSSKDACGNFNAPQEVSATTISEPIFMEIFLSIKAKIVMEVCMCVFVSKTPGYGNVQVF